MRGRGYVVDDIVVAAMSGRVQEGVAAQNRPECGSRSEKDWMARFTAVRGRQHPPCPLRSSSGKRSKTVAALARIMNEMTRRRRTCSHRDAGPFIRCTRSTDLGVSLSFELFTAPGRSPRGKRKYFAVTPLPALPLARFRPG